MPQLQLLTILLDGNRGAVGRLARGLMHARAAGSTAVRIVGAAGDRAGVVVEHRPGAGWVLAGWPGGGLDTTRYSADVVADTVAIANMLDA